MIRAVSPAVGRHACIIAVAAALHATPATLHAQSSADRPPETGVESIADEALIARDRVRELAVDRLNADLTAIDRFRPSYPFWRHIFAVPDGSVAYGSRADGRLLAVFPTAGDWTRTGRWEEPALAAALSGASLPARTDLRRDEVARLLEGMAGPVVHNPTRGRFLAPNAARYGAFLSEWGAIYERFGVPAEIGLSQAIIESGLNGTVRSEARAVGFCQWLESNWNRLNRLSPHVIESGNQTTQAPYCAAYLTILATKYNSYLPALSEHHAGGTNVGRTVIAGARLGGEDIRAQYFLGSQLALSLRELSPERYSDVYRTYGPRSFRYTELVFGNMATVVELRTTVPQRRIYAYRPTRNVPIEEITRRTGLSVDEVRRFNPALRRQVPARANLYLPAPIGGFGPDVSFWHRPPSEAFASTLAEFLAVDLAPELWDEPAALRVLGDYRRRFEATRSEEGIVMAVVLAYVIDEARTSRRGDILKEYRESPRIAALMGRGAREAGIAPPPPAGSTSR
jgi:hypothetical protein